MSLEEKSWREEMIAIRRDLHAHPELGYEEKRTSQVVAQQLASLGIQATTGIAKTGVVGFIRGKQDRRTILLRADMDALPIQEANEVEYRSRHDGKMHACGHDGHTAIALGVARWFSQAAPPSGNLKFAFQPAEEGGAGAKVMIDEGIMEDPRVEACFGLHLWSELAVGKVGVRAGPLLAYADSLEITIDGKGGHAAAPHQTVDPIVVASHVIVALQSIVSRNIAPLKSAVVSITSIEAGNTYNVVPDRAHLKGTARCFDDDVHAMLQKRIPEVAHSVCAAFGAIAEVKYELGYPVTKNDPQMAELVRRAAIEVVGEENVVEAEQSLGGEDMSFFLQTAPGCFFVVGARNEAKGIVHPHHNPRFNIDEDALLIGAKVMAQVVKEYFSQRETVIC